MPPSGSDAARAGSAACGVVPQERIELSTSPLPRARSTTELLRHRPASRMPQPARQRQRPGRAKPRATARRSSFGSGSGAGIPPRPLKGRERECGAPLASRKGASGVCARRVHCPAPPVSRRKPMIRAAFAAAMPMPHLTMRNHADFEIGEIGLGGDVALPVANGVGGHGVIPWADRRQPQLFGRRIETAGVSTGIPSTTRPSAFEACAPSGRSRRSPPP